MPLARRTFLSASSMTVAGLGLGLTRPAQALSLRSKHPVSSLFPQVVDPATLQALAQAGVEAAKSAGAEYADIRVADGRVLSIFQGQGLVPYSLMDFEYGYGLR